ncbi:MAG: glycosyltransferase family 9 protein, partial [Deltaproteobacteria bacterium]
MKRCKVIVTHDSGPMHLASAMQAPVISIFGPTDPRETCPLNSGSYYFWKIDGLDCAPCYSEGEFPDCKDPRCINAVSVEEVYNKMLEILKHLE